MSRNMMSENSNQMANPGLDESRDAESARSNPPNKLENQTK
jgi:hypothetical protein